MKNKNNTNGVRTRDLSAAPPRAPTKWSGAPKWQWYFNFWPVYLQQRTTLIYKLYFSLCIL